MSLNESIVEDAALEWFLLRHGYGGQVGHGASCAKFRRAKRHLAPDEPASRDGGRDSFGEVVLVGRLREAIRRLNPAIPEEARATIRQFRRVQIERRTNP